MVDSSKEMIIDGCSGACLLGYYSPQVSRYPMGLVTLIHGWEGSSDSAYILSTGQYLYEKGYDIFRLNLRDHGRSHHLNKGLFHGALIEETFHAVHNIACLCDHLPFYLVGFSMGGNFALRIAIKHSLYKIPNLKHVVCISPALDPYKSTIAIDESLPIYRYYFLNKWKRSLRKKQFLYPAIYRFEDILNRRTCMALTEAIMPYFPEFKSYQEYFSHYTLLGNVFTDLTIPVTVIASEDDPVVPIADYYELHKSKYLQLLIQKYGGHCGFLNFLPFEHWYLKIMEYIFSKEETL